MSFTIGLNSAHSIAQSTVRSTARDEKTEVSNETVDAPFPSFWFRHFPLPGSGPAPAEDTKSAASPATSALLK
jgi:hypothetical protein